MDLKNENEKKNFSLQLKLYLVPLNLDVKVLKHFDFKYKCLVLFKSVEKQKVVTGVSLSQIFVFCLNGVVFACGMR